MFMLAWQAPNGAAALYHRATSYQGTPDGTHVVVDSFHAPEMAVISWRDTYVIPAGVPIATLADVEGLLIAPEAPFAGATIIPAEAEAVEIARARAWAEVKLRRDACARGGCETPLGRADSDERSRVLIAGAVQMAQIAIAGGEPYSVDWVMADNQPVTHDAPAMIALGMAVGRHIADCWQRAQTLRAAIEAAETVEALAEIDIINGWPGAAA